MTMLHPKAALTLLAWLSSLHGRAEAQDPCTLCPGGESAPNPAAVSSTFGETCETLETSYAPAFTDESSCTPLQIVGVTECGCDRGPVSEDACQFCGGAELADPNVVTDEGSGTTCGYLELAASFLSEGSDSCTSYQFIAMTTCGCPPTSSIENPCSVCPDGSDISAANRDKVLPDFGNLTCGQVETNAILMSVSADSEECSYFQMAGVLGCGCPATSSVENPCSLCADGSPISAANRDKVLPDFGNLTCGQVETSAFISVSADSEECSYFQVAGVLGCGCPAPEDGCSPCPGGGSVPDPDAPFALEEDSTCGEFEAIIRATISEDHEFCGEYQSAALLGCGCPYVAPAGATCPICSDGSSSPDPSQVLFEDDEIGAVTCGVSEWQLAFVPSEMPECDALRATVGAACGCADPPAPACDLCPPGQNVEYLKLIEDPGVYEVDSEGGQVYCGEVIFELSVNASLCEEAREQDVIAKACCSGGASAETTSSTTGAPLADTTAGASTTVPPIETTAGASTTAPPGKITTTSAMWDPDVDVDADADVGAFSGAASGERALSTAVIIAASILIALYG